MNLKKDKTRDNRICRACGKIIPEHLITSPAQRYHPSDECQEIKRQRWLAFRLESQARSVVDRKEALDAVRIKPKEKPRIRKCLGPKGPVHYFVSQGSWDRICPKCKNLNKHLAGGLDDRNGDVI